MTQDTTPAAVEASAPADATALASVLTGALTATLERTRRPAAAPHPYVYLSSDPVCLRQGVLDMQGAPRPEHSIDLIAKFQRADERERSSVAALDRAGFEGRPPFRLVGQQQRIEVKDRGGRVIAVGKVDALIRFDTDPPIVAPAEIKTWSPYLVDGIRDFDDVYNGNWTRSGASQLLLYCFAFGYRFGFLILDRPGIPVIIPVDLEHHLDRVEGFLQRAEAVVDHVAAGTLPDYTTDPGLCRRCNYFGGACNPPVDHGPGAVVLTDPELESILDRREELRASGEEYNRLDRHVKERLRGVEAGFAGKYAIAGTWGKSSRVELPNDLKAKYTRTDPRGRFTLEITKVG